MEIKIGDKVKLKLFGLVMLVNSISKDDNYVECIRIENYNLRFDEFHKDTLEIIK
jgi:uncharacterized protein YodC (DUF2158 family)